MNQERILDISWRTIFKISLAVLILYILYLIRDVIIWIIFAFIISILFNPAINFLRKLRIPRVLATIFVYVGFFGLLSLIIYFIAPIFITEVQQFSQIFPQYLDRISPFLKTMDFQVFGDIKSSIGIFEQTLKKIAANVFNILFVTFGGVLSALFILAVAFFLSLEEKKIEKNFALLFPQKYENFALLLWRRCQRNVNGWFLARILSCFFVGITFYFALWLFKTKYPFSLGLTAGVFNFIPFIGPALTGFLTFLIISLDSITKATFVLIAFILIQLIENNILTPVLSKKFIGLSPTLVLISLVIGGKLWGILGAILMVPIAGILFEFLKDFLKKRKEEKEAGW